jgi:hypothetical protein
MMMGYCKSDSWKVFEYDYVGAPWGIPNNHTHRDINNNLIRVGNSVSLSKKLMDLPLKIELSGKDLMVILMKITNMCAQ